MSFDRLLNQPLTIQRLPVGAVDELGNETFVMTSSTVTTGYVEQTGEEEIVHDQRTYIAQWHVVLRPTETIGPGDRVIAGAATLEIVGPPQQVWNPRTEVVHHIDARARSVVG